MRISHLRIGIGIFADPTDRNLSPKAVEEHPRKSSDQMNPFLFHEVENPDRSYLKSLVLKAKKAATEAGQAKRSKPLNLGEETMCRAF